MLSWVPIQTRMQEGNREVSEGRERRQKEGVKDRGGKGRRKRGLGGRGRGSVREKGQSEKGKESLPWAEKGSRFVTFFLPSATEGCRFRRHHLVWP
jgi:hypothetical protein